MKKFILYLICVCYLFDINLCSVDYYKKKLNSDSVYMVNEDTNMVVVEKNPNKRRSPASLTKIMTFIIVREKLQDQDLDNIKIKVTQDVLNLVDPDSSGVKLKADEEISVNNLLKAMLVSSSGYAAMVLANYVGENSIENFVDMMNQKVTELNCENTHFENPDGIYHENQYSTTSDMYKICKFAINFSDFLDIVNQSECNIFHDERDPVVTTNLMLDKKRGGKYYSPWVIGLKTGYTQESGRCLASYAVNKNKNQSYITVTMGAPTIDNNSQKITDNLAMIDALDLYNWAFNNLKITTMFKLNFPVTETNLEYVLNTDKIILYPENNINIIIPKNISHEDLKLEYNIPETIYAPVQKNNIIGQAKIIYNSSILKEFNLISNQNFKKSYVCICYNKTKKIITNPVIYVPVVFVLAVIIIYILLSLRYNKKIRKYKNKRKKN